MFLHALQIILYLLSGITISIAFYRFFKKESDSVITRASFIISILFFLISNVLPQFADTDDSKKVQNETLTKLESVQEDEVYNIEMIIDDAKEAFDTAGYEKAIEIISEGLLEYPDDELLSKELKKYKSFKPVSITTYDQLKNTTDGDVNASTYVNEYSQDKFGNTYTTSFALSNGSVSFVTKQKYSLLKGVVACPQGIEYDSYRESAKVSVYLDDDVLVWSSSQMKVDSKPQPFEIDITGSDIVTLTWECDGANVWGNWGYYATIFNGEFLK